MLSVLQYTVSSIVILPTPLLLSSTHASYDFRISFPQMFMLTYFQFTSQSQAYNVFNSVY